MTRLAAFALAAMLAAGCGASQAAPEPAAGKPAQARDVRLLARRMQEIHPRLFHDVTRGRFLRAADASARRAPHLGRDRLLVELMRLSALAGERDGHTGVFPLDPAHRRRLHLYPIRLHHFPEGLFVVGEVGTPGLVGARLVAVGGVPVERALRAVRPLVPRDNAWSLRARAPLWLLTAEVLHGLGLTRDAGPLRLAFERPDGTRATVTLRPVAAAEWRGAFGDLFHPMIPLGLPRREAPAYVARREEPLWSERLADGSLYVAYNAAVVDTSAVAEHVRRLDPPRVIVDLRHNPGGDVSTSAPLAAALEGRRPVFLTSRTTFSAAQVFAARLEPEATFVGEPTGGSPSLWGDPAPVTLAAAGVTAHVATRWWPQTGRPDVRRTIEPDVRVDLTAADFFAGRDPVLAAALSAAPR